MKKEKIKTRKEVLLEKVWNKKISLLEREEIKKEILRTELQEKLGLLAEKIKKSEKPFREELSKWMREWEEISKKLRELE